MAKKYEHGLDKWWFGKDDKKKNRVADSSTPTAEEFNKLMDMVEKQGEKITKMHSYLKNQEQDITALQSLMESLRSKHPDWWGNKTEPDSYPVPATKEWHDWQMDKFRKMLKPDPAYDQGSESE